MADLPFSSTQLLAGVASALLLFVSGGVIYLSAVEWRDRRRRRAVAEGAAKGGPPRSAVAGKARSVSSGMAQSRRSPSRGSSPRS